jgi:hypothetical protein
MKAQIAEQVELFSESELESLEFVPEELEAIEAERVPDLDSISFEDIAEDLEAAFEQDGEAVLEVLKKIFNTLTGKGKGGSSGTKGGHSSGKSPSNREKHQKGDARRKQDQQTNPERREHDDYRKRGGKLGFDAWKREGKPRS